MVSQSVGQCEYIVPMSVSFVGFIRRLCVKVVPERPHSGNISPITRRYVLCDVDWRTSLEMH